MIVHRRRRFLHRLGPSLFIPLAGIGAVAGLAATSAGSPPAPVNVTNDLSTRWGEPEIAVNPKNPNNIVQVIDLSELSYACKAKHEPKCDIVTAAGFMQPRGLAENVPGFSAVMAFASFDRGRTWKGVKLPLGPSSHPDLVIAGHPTATVGPDGTFYAAYNTQRFGARGDYPNPDRPNIPSHHGGIAVTRSTDGGRTWSDPVFGGTPIDHPFMTADLSTGSIYISSGAPGVMGPLANGEGNAKWGDSRGVILDRWVVSSKDGVHWSMPQPFGGPSGSSSFVPFIGAANGVLATAYRATSPERCGTASPCTIFQTSTDSGKSWTRHGVPLPQYTGGTQPLMAVDPSKPGHYTLALLLAPSKQFSVYQTGDSGKTWTGPTNFTEDPDKTHAKPWIAYSPDGVLALTWETNDPGPATTCPGGTSQSVPFNVWAVTSGDGGKTFNTPVKLTSTPSAAPDPCPGGTAGDALATFAIDRKDLLVGWGDWRLGEGSVVFSRVSRQAFTRR